MKESDCINIVAVIHCLRRIFLTNRESSRRLVREPTKHLRVIRQLDQWALEESKEQRLSVTTRKNEPIYAFTGPGRSQLHGRTAVVLRRLSIVFGRQRSRVRCD